MDYEKIKNFVNKNIKPQKIKTAYTICVRGIVKYTIKVDEYIVINNIFTYLKISLYKCYIYGNKISYIQDYIFEYMNNENNESLGIIFEKSICLLYKIQFNGVFKYDLNLVYELKSKLNNLKNIFPYELKHTAKNGYKYDFELNDKRLSAKTSKNSGKICPHTIGQTTKQNFCKYFNINFTNNTNIKVFIIDNINLLLYINSLF